MNCPHFNNCSAPLCPQDESSLISAIWYPGEDICKHHSVLTKNQKQLRRNKHLDYYFTYSMLERPMEDLNDPNMKGIDVELAERPDAVAKWLRKYHSHLIIYLKCVS
jgi:hypothetical protein